MNKKMIVLSLLVGLSTCGAVSAQGIALQDASSPYVAGCGNTPAFPEVGFVRMHDTYLNGAAIVMVTGQDGLKRGMGLIYAGGAIENIATFGGIGCDSLSWDYQQI